MKTEQRKGLSLLGIRSPNPALLCPLAAGLFLMLAGTVGARAAEAASSAAAAAGNTVTVELEYQEVPRPLSTVWLSFGPGPAAFRKEPDFGGRKVVRSVLQIGSDTNYHVPLILDQKGGALYLDLNRNGDFTDDPDGIRTSAAADYFGHATNIHLTLGTAFGVQRVLVDLNLWPAGTTISGNAQERSWLQAKATLAGVDWQIGVTRSVLDARSGYLIVRPWEERERPFDLRVGTPDAANFNGKGKFFIGGRSYEVAGRHERRGDEAVYKLEFAEQHPKLGQLTASGENLHRLILKENQGYTVLIDQFGTRVKVPVGTYRLEEVWLRKGDAEAIMTSPKPVSITEATPVSLTLGGPLSSKAEVQRKGRTLKLNYKLVGADGGTYRFVRAGGPVPPEAHIYMGDKEVASGSFQFG